MISCVHFGRGRVSIDYGLKELRFDLEAFLTLTAKKTAVTTCSASLGNEGSIKSVSKIAGAAKNWRSRAMMPCKLAPLSRA